MSEPLDAEQEVRTDLNQMEVIAAYPNVKVREWKGEVGLCDGNSKGLRVIGMGWNVQAAFEDAQSKLPKPAALGGHRTWAEVKAEVQAKVPSPLAEFEHPKRYGLYEAEHKDIEYRTVILAADYDRLLNFTRQLLKEKG